MEISLKLESMPTLCRSAFLPADTTITRRVATTIEVASSVVHRRNTVFGGLRTITSFRPPGNWLKSLYRHSRKSPATDELALVPRGTVYKSKNHNYRNTSRKVFISTVSNTQTTNSLFWRLSFNMRCKFIVTARETATRVEDHTFSIRESHSPSQQLAWEFKIPSQTLCSCRSDTALGPCWCSSLWSGFLGWDLHATTGRFLWLEWHTVGGTCGKACGMQTQLAWLLCFP